MLSLFVAESLRHLQYSTFVAAYAGTSVMATKEAKEAMLMVLPGRPSLISCTPNSCAAM